MVLLMDIENEILEVKRMGKVAIIALRSEGPFLDGASNRVLERELHEILSDLPRGKRIPRYWFLEKIAVLDE